MNLYLFIVLTYACIQYLKSDDLNLNLPENECPRIRRAWHELSTTERELYISGLLQLRENGNGNFDQDEFIAIASVHEDNFAPVTHKASSYLYWHGYLTYELESRIRNLGEKYKCFAMPYWDYTIEHGRERNPFIFSTGLGGDGDINDYRTVNEYSWKYSTKDYWVPFNCLAKNDQYPICSLKRAVRGGFQMPTAEDIGKGIIANPDFTRFAKWYATSSNPVHLFTGDAVLAAQGSPVITSYDPIWYLFHSMVQYHQAMWTVCNGYDLIDPNDLDDHPEAYKPYCVHGECLQETPDWPTEWLRQGLDDKMHFGGSLESKDWSYIHRNDLTVRKLYNLAEWGIVYDLGNGDGFYEKSGLKEYCKGKLNDKWFILNDKNTNENKYENVLSKSTKTSYIATHFSYNSVFMIMFLLSATIGCVWYVCNKEKKGINNNTIYSYGTV